MAHPLAAEQSEPGGNRKAGESGTHGMAQLLWPIQSVKVHQCPSAFQQDIGGMGWAEI